MAQLRAQGLTLEEIGKRLGVTQQCIGATLRSRRPPDQYRIRCRKCDRDMSRLADWRGMIARSTAWSA
jgi:hypothetical protein